LALALLLAFGIRTFALQAFFIPSGSMIPTLEIGDRILVDKAFFSYHGLKPGDIIVFKEPPHDTMCGPPVAELVKRVIGLPGQRLYSVGDTIYVNGHSLAQPWLPVGDHLTLPIPLVPDGSQPATRSHPYVVPANSFYVLGDNRSISCDSRYWGPVAGNTIIGQVVLRWWHNGHPDFHIF
jgi:signal peptidase I